MRETGLIDTVEAASRVLSCGNVYAWELARKDDVGGHVVSSSKIERVFARSGLSVPIVELALRVDEQPASNLVVLVALDTACLPLPF